MTTTPTVQSITQWSAVPRCTTHCYPSLEVKSPLQGQMRKSCMVSRVFSDSLGLKVDRWTVFKQYPMLLGPLEKFINGRHVIECDLSPSRGIDFLSFQSWVLYAFGLMAICCSSAAEHPLQREVGSSFQDFLRTCVFTSWMSMMSVKTYENSQRTNWAVIVLGNLDVVESETVFVVQTMLVLASIMDQSMPHSHLPFWDMQVPDSFFETGTRDLK